MLAKSPTWVRDRMYVGRLGDKGRVLVLTGKLPLAHAREIAKVADPDLREDMALDYAAGRKAWLEAAEASTASQASRFKRRLTTATILHHLLMNRAALRITRSLARRKMMPFQTLLHLVR